MKAAAAVASFLLLGTVIFAPSARCATETAQAIPGQPIDLPTALRLAGANNLDLAIVQQRLLEAKAADDAARLRFFPWLSTGVSYEAHKNAFPAADGTIIDADKQLYNPGASIVAGVDLGNAIYQKLSTKQQYAAAGSRAEAQRNDTLLAAASGYFELVNAASELAIAQEAVRISSDYEQQLERAFAIGIAEKSDQLRVSVQTQRYQIIARQAAERLRLDAAALAQLLHLDPTITLTPADQTPRTLVLVPDATEVSMLIAEALTARPEVQELAALEKSADWDRIGATYGPLIPTLGTQLSYGGLGGGPDGNLAGIRSAEDYAVMLNWRIGPGGLFDFSRIDAAKSRLEQARLGTLRVRDQIEREVVQAYESARSAKDQIGIAQSNVELAQQTLQLSIQRRQFGVGAVLEVIQAQQDLTQARTDLVRAQTFYDVSEYNLAHAVARIDRLNN